MRSSPKFSTHVPEHCDTPRISRRWRKLGAGAAWRCTCGQWFWLKKVPLYEATGWRWEKSRED